MATICHLLLLVVLHVQQFHHNAYYAAMPRLALPAIPVIIWPTLPLVVKVYSSLTALITRKVIQPVSHAIKVTFYRQAPPAPAAQLLLHIVPSAVLLLLAFNVLVAIIYQIQLPVFLAMS
jgi:hypothetical protein